MKKINEKKFIAWRYKYYCDFSYFYNWIYYLQKEKRNRVIIKRLIDV